MYTIKFICGVDKGRITFRCSKCSQDLKKRGIFDKQKEFRVVKCREEAGQKNISCGTGCKEFNFEIVMSKPIGLVGVPSRW